MEKEKSIKQQAINELAPCGMDCSRCVSFKSGKVSQLSHELLDALQGYEKLAHMAADFNPIMAHYDDFIKLLTHFTTTAHCVGCRFTNEGGCGIRTCHKKNHVDFCFECPHYQTCSPDVYNDHVLQIWRNNNDEMTEKGIENYYLEQKTKPRY